MYISFYAERESLQISWKNLQEECAIEQSQSLNKTADAAEALSRQGNDLPFQRQAGSTNVMTHWLTCSETFPLRDLSLNPPKRRKERLWQIAGAIIP